MAIQGKEPDIQGGRPVIDAERLMAEIEAEVQARRAAGDLPADFERDLDLAFARFAPVGAAGDDIESVVVRAEHAAFLDLATPDMTGPPGVPLMKRVLRKLVFFYFHHVAQQVTTLALVLTRGLSLLGKRLDRLERLTPGAVGEQPLPAPPSAHLVFWQEWLTPKFARVRGRVLHGDCGAGELVSVFRSAGLDAYGVGATPGSTRAAESADLELRSVATVEHLRALGRGTLAGLALSGCVDRSVVGVQREIVELASTTLAAGAPFALIGTSPAAWERTVGPVVADLAPGRPLHAETWVALLEGAGFTEIEVQSGPSAGALTTVPGDDETAAALNANVERLNALLFAPTTYCVVAEAPGPGPR